MDFETAATFDSAPDSFDDGSTVLTTVLQYSIDGRQLAD